MGSLGLAERALLQVRAGAGGRGRCWERGLLSQCHRWPQSAAGMHARTCSVAGGLTRARSLACP